MPSRSASARGYEMKFWQLMSVARDQPNLVERLASSRDQWTGYAELARVFPALVKAQDRARLDSVVDDDFVAVVLGELQGHCYRAKDHWLRSWRMDASDEALSMAAVFQTYGGNVLEEVLERGSVLVDR